MEVGLKNNRKGENKRIKEESTRGQRSAEGGQGWDVAQWWSSSQQTQDPEVNSQHCGKGEFDANMKRAERAQKPTRR